MNKRGDISLEAIVKTLPHIFVFIFLIVALASIYTIVSSKSVSMPQKDMQRVASELMALSPAENFQVFLTGASYKMVLYGKDFEDKPKQCSTKPCLCVLDSSGTEKCEVLKTADTKTSCPLTCTPDCRRETPCVSDKTYNVVPIPEFKPEQPKHTLVVCRQGTKLAIGVTADECGANIAKTG